MKTVIEHLIWKGHCHDTTPFPRLGVMWGVLIRFQIKHAYPKKKLNLRLDIINTLPKHTLKGLMRDSTGVNVFIMQATDFILLLELHMVPLVPLMMIPEQKSWKSPEHCWVSPKFPQHPYNNEQLVTITT